MIEETRDEWLIGIRLRDSASADDYKLVDDVSPSAWLKLRQVDPDKFLFWINPDEQAIENRCS